MGPQVYESHVYNGLVNNSVISLNSTDIYLLDLHPLVSLTNLTHNVTGHVKSTVSSIVFSSIMFFIGVFGNVTAFCILVKRPSKDSK